MGSSAAILSAGGNLDSLMIRCGMVVQTRCEIILLPCEYWLRPHRRIKRVNALRYQGVDWRDEASWGCNGGQAPNGVSYYDGTDLDPYEVWMAAIL